VAYNFQTGNNKIKLLTEYEDVTQNVLFGNAVLAALMSGRKYGLDVMDLSGLKIIGHGNPDNNLESSCISRYISRLCLLSLCFSSFDDTTTWMNYMENGWMLVNDELLRIWKEVDLTFLKLLSQHFPGGKKFVPVL
jgi:hypothetical protein